MKYSRHERETDRYKDRQRLREPETHRDRETHRETQRQKQTDRRTEGDREREKETERDRKRQTDVKHTTINSQVISDAHSQDRKPGRAGEGGEHMMIISQVMNIVRTRRERGRRCQPVMIN